MKHFKELLQPLSESRSEDMMLRMSAGDIPVSPKFFSELLGKKNEIYFHALSKTNIHGLIKLQGKKKTVSCFNQWKGDVTNNIAYGPEGGGFNNPLMAVLKGDYALHSNTDMWSQNDDEGRRWIAKADIETQMGDFADLFESLGNKLADWYYKNHAETMKLSNKDIKEYFDYAYKLLKDNKNKILKIAMDEVGEYGYNELLGHSFKIQEILCFTLASTDIDSLREQYPNITFTEIKETKLNTYMRKLIK